MKPSRNHPPRQPFYWPWPPAVVYGASEEERLIKSIAPLGQGEGHWYWPLWYGRWPLHVVQAAALDSCRRPTQRGELRQSTVCIHALLLLCLFVCLSSCECLCLWDCLSWTRAGGGEKKREVERRSLSETIRGVMMKRNPSAAESEPLETPLTKWNPHTVP